MGTLSCREVRAKWPNSKNGRSNGPSVAFPVHQIAGADCEEYVPFISKQLLLEKADLSEQKGVSRG